MEPDILETESVQTLLQLCDLHTPLQGHETKDDHHSQKKEITYFSPCLGSSYIQIHSSSKKFRENHISP